MLDADSWMLVVRDYRRRQGMRTIVGLFLCLFRRFSQLLCNYTITEFQGIHKMQWSQKRGFGYNYLPYSSPRKYGISGWFVMQNKTLQCFLGWPDQGFSLYFCRNSVCSYWRVKSHHNIWYIFLSSRGRYYNSWSDYKDWFSLTLNPHCCSVIP